MTAFEILCSCRLMYEGLIGGALAFRREHFVQVNGFGNKFFGWGGEDDDMWQRYLDYRSLHGNSTVGLTSSRSQKKHLTLF